MKLAALLMAAALAGCAATPKVQTSNPRSVVVNARVAADAQQAAETECARYGRHARLGGPGGRNAWFFDCVE